MGTCCRWPSLFRRSRALPPVFRRVFGLLLASVLALVLALGLVSMTSCGSKHFRGFFEEDLSRYLTLPDLSTLTYEPFDGTVSDSEIDAVIAQRLEAVSELIETSSPVSSGCTVRFDRFCFIDGESFPSLSEEGGVYVCGASYADDVLTQLLSGLIGKSKGEVFELSVTLPSGYSGEGSPSRPAVYRITVLAVYERSLPELTDELAVSLFPGCTGLSDLRSTVSASLLASKRSDWADRLGSSLFRQLVDGSELKSLPSEVCTEHFEDLYRTYSSLAEAESLSLEDYADKYLSQDEAALEASLWERAREMTTEELVLYSFAKQEGITATEEELSTYASSLAASSDGMFSSGEEVLAYYGREALTSDYLDERVVARLISIASGEGQGGD